jgi:hypothetical protein
MEPQIANIAKLMDNPEVRNLLEKISRDFLLKDDSFGFVKQPDLLKPKEDKKNTYGDKAE